MKQRYLVPCLILVGLCLLAVSFAWNRIIPSEAYWDIKQASEFAAAQADLHSMSHANRQDKEYEKKLAAARQRFLNSHEALEQARGAQSRTATLVMAGGIMLLLLGIVLHLRASHTA